MQLIGKLYRDKTDGWTADWMFVDNGKVLSKWTSTDSDARRAMAAGADGAADALMKRYAKPGKGARPARALPRRPSPASAAATISSACRATCRSCRSCAGSPRCRPRRTASQFELELVSGLAGFKRAVGADGVLDGGEGEPRRTGCADGTDDHAEPRLTRSPGSCGGCSGPRSDWGCAGWCGCWRRS